MLLAIDIGNTNTVLGVFEGERLIKDWRIVTSSVRTADEYVITLNQLFALGGLDIAGVSSAIVSSVVPAATKPLCDSVIKHLGVKALVVGPGLKSGMPILLENPKEVGADRVVNAVAAYEKHQGGLVVVDFGTATTFDVISEKGEYLGGAICPGINISADALYRHAAKLPRVDVSRPASVVGKNTVSSMQSGLYFGYVGLVDGLVARMIDELDFPVKVVATGGLAPLIAGSSSTIEEVDELLTLTGLRLIHKRNRP